MNEELLQPSSLDAPQPDGGKPGPGRRKFKGIWIVLVFVIAGLWGIRQLSHRVVDEEQANPTPTPSPIPTATPDPALRAEAEAAMEKMLALLGPLRPADPERWAGEEWKAIQQDIDRGDAAMADGKFQAATTAYTLVLPKLSQLTQQLPGLPTKLLPQAQAAYAKGEKEQAVALLQIVLFVEPENPEAKALLLRAEKADQSFALLQKAKALVAEGKWDLAYAELSRLESMDAAFPGGATLKQQVSQVLSNAEFKKWISQAVRALENNDLDSAQILIAKAVGFKPEDPAVLALQQQIADRVTQQNVLKLKREAEVLAHEENWTEAHKRWLEMKALDPEAPWVQQGLDQSLKWKVLEEKINKGLADPRSAQTGLWVREMQDREGWPPKLNAQAEKLIEKWKSATTPVSLKIVSDHETRVEISRVGRWDPFWEKELSLKPGSYVAKGIRLGYRDVRVTFEVKPGQSDLKVDVVCVEGIR